MTIAFAAAVWVRYGVMFDEWIRIIYGTILMVLCISYICIFALFESYQDFFKRGFFEELIRVGRLNLILALFISGVFFFFKIGAVYSRVFFVTFFLFNMAISYLLRQYFKIILLGYFKQSKLSNKVMLVTTSTSAESILSNIKKEREWGFQITGVAIVDKNMAGKEINGVPVVAHRENLFDVVTKEVVDEVLINVPNARHLQLDEAILEFENIGLTVNVSIATFNLRVHEKTLKNFGGYNVLTFTTRVYNTSSMLIKRFLDIVGALVGLTLTFFISLLIVPAILIESPGPIIFSQTRIGKNGRRFKIYKFRSMYADAEKRKKELMAQNEMQGLMFKITKDPRITKVGAFIRKTSLDELPQFFNVLKGDMSLVGTRPPTEDEFLQYEGRHKRRLALKPGITGLWQVSGRSDIDNFEDVVKLDLEYIDNWSILLDMKLLLKTVGVVVFRVGAR
ncbi:sugar transferase [Aminipila butyrica]|uniref:Sugar transferase n=2 Tax=Aminipila butyrica TaxID=433296 RepID=A0A858BZL9_9FIRM|nr:sugar transferase [Aminipila butyrica]